MAVVAGATTLQDTYHLERATVKHGQEDSANNDAANPDDVPVCHDTSACDALKARIVL